MGKAALYVLGCGVVALARARRSGLLPLYLVATLVGLTLIALFAGAGDSSAGPAADEFVVNISADFSDPNIDGICDVFPLIQGNTCTLRAAIEEANNSVGLSSIEFNIAGDGIHTIELASPLPVISQPTLIDGYSQPGAVPNTNTTDQGINAHPTIVVDGGNLTSGSSVLHVNADDSTVRGLVIQNFPSRGIRVDGDNNKVEGNFIGTNAAGDTSATVGYALQVGGANNVVGGTAAMARNLVVGGSTGVYVTGATAVNNKIVGNLIGTDASGTVALGGVSSGVGMVLGAAGNTIGGTIPAERNVISGNAFGVQFPVNGGNNTIAGNFIGTQVDGITPLPNTSIGVYLFGGSHATVGGSDGVSPGSCTGACNVISGNGTGIAVNSAGGGPDAGASNTIGGNYIGPDVNGGPLGNNGTGVLISDVDDNVVGGTGDAMNLIAYNDGPGVLITEPGAAGNFVGMNAIHSNGGLGIDLTTTGNTPDGVTDNDDDDADTGANGLQNYPELSSALSDGTMQGSLNSRPGRAFTIRFFANGSCDPSSYGEGELYLGSAEVTTDGSGDAQINADVDSPPPGMPVITATATDETTGDTSEFSACVTAEAVPTPTPTTGPSGTPTPTPTATPTASATPTPIVPPGDLLQGDVDCNDLVNSVDSLKILRHVAQLSVAQNEPCPDIGTEVASLFGDADCNGNVSSVDALKVLRFVAALPVSQSEPCTDISDPL